MGDTPSPRRPLPVIRPEVPIYAFRIQVENPITSHDDEVDEVDGDLSPNSSFCSRPSTPPREQEDVVQVQNHAEEMWLERSESRMLSKSKETVRPGTVCRRLAEVTPKAGKGLGAAKSGVKIQVI